MVVSEFNGKLYLSIRRWFWSTWDEEYFPTKDGITLPYTDETIDGLLAAFANILSNEELKLLDPTTLTSKCVRKGKKKA